MLHLCGGRYSEVGGNKTDWPQNRLCLTQKRREHRPLGICEPGLEGLGLSILSTFLNWPLSRFFEKYVYLGCFSDSNSALGPAGAVLAFRRPLMCFLLGETIPVYCGNLPRYN